MTLPTKFNADNRLPKSPDKSRNSFRPVGEAGRTNSSEIKPDRPRVGRLTFFEDFTLEHTLHGVHLTSIEMAGIF